MNKLIAIIAVAISLSACSVINIVNVHSPIDAKASKGEATK